MKKCKPNSYYFVLIILLFVSVPSFAMQNMHKGYLEASIVTTDFSNIVSSNMGNLDNLTYASNYFDFFNKQKKDTGFRIAGGYSFSPYFSLELGYQDLGSSKLEATETFTFDHRPPETLCCIIQQLDIDGVDLRIIGLFSLSERLSLLANAGIFFWHSSINTTDSLDYPSDFTLSPNTTYTESSSDLFLGAGLRYAYNKHIAVKFNFDRYTVSDEFIDITGVSLQYVF